MSMMLLLGQFGRFISSAPASTMADGPLNFSNSPSKSTSSRSGVDIIITPPQNQTPPEGGPRPTSRAPFLGYAWHSLTHPPIRFILNCDLLSNRIRILLQAGRPSYHTLYVSARCGMHFGRPMALSSAAARYSEKYRGFAESGSCSWFPDAIH